MLVSESPRRRGRPRAENPSVRMTTHIPESYYDRITRTALRHGVSVSSVARRAIQISIDEAISRLNK